MMVREITGYKLFLFLLCVVMTFSFNFYLLFHFVNFMGIYILKLFSISHLGGFWTSILVLFVFIASCMITMFMVGFASFYFNLRFRSASSSGTGDNYTPLESFDSCGDSGIDCGGNSD